MRERTINNASRPSLLSISLVKPSFLLEIQTGKTNSGFPRNFLRRYLCNRSPEMRTKNLKNFILSLAIVNYQSWMDASVVSPPANFVSN